ncbi:hypothetical protein SteCoe_32347 [Stentor coeruleus]|uniref:EF-hand domain-containing protein n=1 Tax=Stentor coeruleus TaxID=5963 RepID=A0A1R2AZ87_9CILI|nr:hypothetical protein SteCoe_32347 [Stentor coeruleus]
MSGYEEERKAYSKSPVNKISKDPNLIHFARPFTAKKLEIDRNTTFKKYFGRNNSGIKGKKSGAKEKSPLVAKLKPSRITIDKERLYIENMELKLKNNELTETLVKYKARILKLEREKQKKSEITLGDNFDKTPDIKVSNLLKIIDDNHREIQKLKDKLKSGKNLRIKTEKNFYMKEDLEKQHHEIECLKTEIIEKSKKYKSDLESMKKEHDDEKRKNFRIQDKLNKANDLIENLYKELKSIRTKKPSKFAPPKCLTTLKDLAKSLSKSISEFLKTIDQSNSKKIDTSQFLYNLKCYDNSITNKDIDLIINCIKAEDPSKISIKKLINYFNTFDFTLEAYPNISLEIDNLLQHLCLRMQLHRVPKENLIEALVGAGPSNIKSIHSQEIVLLFTNTPFNFSRKEATQIAEFLFQGKKTMQYRDFVDKLYLSIDDWEIFTTKDEENFDAYLLNLVSTNEPYLQRACEDRDLENKGLITMEEFQMCLNERKIVLPPRVLMYLLVLFYSHNMELNIVPYRQFFQAYNSTEDNPEEKKEDMSQKYLELISQCLKFKNKTVRNTFHCDSNGNILAEDFIQGLKLLEIENIPKDNLVELLENLQGNPEERIICVNIVDLENVMESLGVPIDQSAEHTNRSETESLAESHEGHVQKVSLLDSVQIDTFELSDFNHRLSESPSPPPTTLSKHLHLSNTFDNF